MNTHRLNQPKVALATWRSFVPAVTGAMAILGLAACAEKPVTSMTKLDGQTPSGTVEMHQVQAAFIGSGDAGSGVLHYKGHDYPFDVGGLGFGGFGVSTISAEGAVYHLADAKQLGGVYGQGRYGVALGDMKRGGGDLWLENGAGVVMHLRSRREGLILGLGADGVVVAMTEKTASARCET